MTKVAIFADFPFGVLAGQMAGRGGGHISTWLPQLAKAWEGQKECELHWVIPDRSVRRVESARFWGQTFHRLPAMGITASFLLARWPHRLAFRKILHEIRPDVIHCWGTETLNGAALCDFAGPSILSMQGMISTYSQVGDLKGWRWGLFRHWEPISIQRATVVSSESQWGLDQVEKIAPGKAARKIEYGVFPTFYDVRWAPETDQPRILFAGGLNRLKGVDILVKMLRRHPRRNWKMVFAGCGYLEEELRALNDPTVEILGTLKTQEVQEQMAKAWALVLPSRADTSPNVVKEARVIGLPVVVSPHGGHAEYVEHGRDGLIVASEDSEDWFAALDRLCCDFGSCREMGAARHKFFRDHFRPENTAKAFLELYQELAGMASAPL